MLKTACTHPDLLYALAKCGHGDKILIADGNFCLESYTHPDAAKIRLNLTAGIPTVTDVLRVITQTINIEQAEVMLPDHSSELPIYSEFADIIGDGISLNRLERFEFYEVSKKENVKIAVATGDLRLFANIILTVGVVTSA
ncbi:RbsD/FucU family protein [Paenibacillus beijingensis]|uniref:Uncharacterized protein n=1 Tax=Paenibacillus beijingensis TaxID=1126833 RepID=A0A0D5NRK7_9BACL|nr:RbsD/FucU family protein [Paenibacillus beijingensis]AJY77538.1 hypothetical protein VN24_05845 [Paenibacillus beijingensis]